ncbi:chromate transporter [Sporolactobacillus sp. CPB3-1]|uniref:Chromate transporter n=1 Tax=Sporolactobacillus mangiferae TaxID=2940498 RepID=A0ABT0M8S7_9BACL|nr:chromate transporter [Sporolactobacillus mangiferae]MCL1631259.1 chromate transporter [Sporolactobacillus mangiferae]
MTQQEKQRALQRSSLAIHWDLFIAFFRSGMVSFGGGPSGIPLIEAEVVKRYHWMTIEEFGNLVALANALPGPINTKLAGYVGWKVKGFTGMLAALLAVVLPTVILMIALLGVLVRFGDQRWVRGMTQAVLPVVGVLMAQLTWQFMKNAGKGLGWTISLILTGLSFVLMEVLHVHPAILIALTLLLVLLKPSKKKASERG